MIRPVVILFLAGVFIFPAAARAARPNVVVILTDDQGWGDLSIHGNTALETPNIDRLAKSGAQFDRFYVCPVCSPTRAEFLTGRYHVRSGVWSTSRGGERMNADETTIADVFKEAGYKTAAFGKWHNGMQFPYHPNARGFDEFYGFCSGHWGNYFSPMLEHNGEIVTGNGFVIDDFTERAMHFIEENRDRPFFVYLPYNTPHSPMQVPDRWWNKFKDKELTQDHPKKKSEKVDHTRAALAMCENIDWNVGRMMAKLDELGLADNTIMVYFCDNGPNGARWNGGMRGRKGSTDEGGVRSPLFIRWPARIRPGIEIQEICAAIDLLPTLTDLADVPRIGDKALDGESLVHQLLEGQDDAVWDRRIFSYWKNKLSVRVQPYRLSADGGLYDMVADPGQTTDVSQKASGIADQLRRAADDWRKIIPPGLRDDQRPFVIGHPGAKYTHIPARDGTAHGTIKRSNRFPNDSYFTNWTSTEDRIIWDCEVGQTGDYRVELFYTCPKADVGSTVELSFNGNRITGKISEAHDPPLQGMEHDRFERMESYTKDFRRMTLGTIHLEKGKGELVFRAVQIPRSQVMDFRLLYLTRMEK